MLIGGEAYRDLLEENLLSSICKITKKKLSIMVDYHYCSHNVKDFPNNIDFPELGLIRVCLRKEDIAEGCRFVKQLKKYTSCKLSINFFNINNYEEDDSPTLTEALT